MIQRDLGDTLVYIKQLYGGSPDVIRPQLSNGKSFRCSDCSRLYRRTIGQSKTNDFVAQSLLIEPSEEELRSMDGGGGIFEIVLA